MDWGRVSDLDALARNDESGRFPHATSSSDVRPQVPPSGIVLPDQLDLPRPIPFLELLFPGDRTLHISVHLEIYQVVHAILFREPFDYIILVLPNTLHEITSHANVERTMSFAGEYVDHRLFVHGESGLDSRLRGNDKTEDE